MKNLRVGQLLLISSGMVFTALLFQNCSLPQSALHRPGSRTDSSNDSSGGLDAFTDTELAAKFTSTLQPTLQTNCSACHGSFQVPMFAVANATEAVVTIRQFNLVNLKDPMSSRFLEKLRGGHNGFPSSTHDAVHASIVNWAAELNGSTLQPDLEYPAGTITSPTANASVSGVITITAIATDNVGVAGVQFKLNGANIGSEITAPPYSYSLNTATLGNGSHSVRAVIRDTSNLIANTPAVNFTVPAPVTDTTPPTVSLTTPAANASLTGSVTLSATASDNVGVVGVQFYVNGSPVGAEDTSAPYSVVWNSSTAGSSNNFLTARARDAAGNSTTSANVSVVVLSSDTQPPTCAINSPSANASVTGTVSVTVSTTDNVSTVGVQLYVDNVLITDVNSPPFTISWDSTTVPNGSHSLQLRCRDASGNVGVSANRTVTVTNTVTNPQATYTWINNNILIPKCLACHGSSVASAGVRFNTYTNTKREVVNGNPGASPLFTETDSGSMPTTGKLSDTEINAIRDWILAGAPQN